MSLRRWVCGVVLLWSTCVWAGELQPLPVLGAYATDLTGSLRADQLAALEARLVAHHERTGGQLMLLLLPSTAPESIEQFAIRLMEHWQPGRKGKDDGAILILARDDRTLRLEVGYGLEGQLSDATAKRIVSDVITPYLRDGDYAGGIAAGFNAIEAYLDDPVSRPAPMKPGGGAGVDESFVIPAVVAGGLFLLLLFASLARLVRKPAAPSVPAAVPDTARPTRRKLRSRRAEAGAERLSEGLAGFLIELVFALLRGGGAAGGSSDAGRKVRGGGGSGGGGGASGRW
jgi:uncharacterized protein